MDMKLYLFSRSIEHASMSSHSKFTKYRIIFLRSTMQLLFVLGRKRDFPKTSSACDIDTPQNVIALDEEEESYYYAG